MRNLILFLLTLQFTLAQEKVTGIVIDTNGKPVEKVQVQAPEIGISVTSNSSGEFELIISEKALLTFSASNYETYVTEASPGEILSIILQTDLSATDNITSNLQLIILSDDELNEDDQAAGNLSLIHILTLPTNA